MERSQGWPPSSHSLKRLRDVTVRCRGTTYSACSRPLSECAATPPSSRRRPPLAVPLRAVQCRAPLKNGDEAGRRCKKKAILGGFVCRSHGAQLPAVQQAAARAVDDARLRLLLATEDAVVVLETLLDEG